jgi:hypothetical protein
VGYKMGVLRLAAATSFSSIYYLSSSEPLILRYIYLLIEQAIRPSLSTNHESFASAIHDPSVL